MLRHNRGGISEKSVVPGNAYVHFNGVEEIAGIVTSPADQDSASPNRV